VDAAAADVVDAAADVVDAAADVVDDAADVVDDAAADPVELSRQTTVPICKRTRRKLQLDSAPKPPPEKIVKGKPKPDEKVVKGKPDEKVAKGKPKPKAKKSDNTDEEEVESLIKLISVKGNRVKNHLGWKDTHQRALYRKWKNNLAVKARTSSSHATRVSIMKYVSEMITKYFEILSKNSLRSVVFQEPTKPPPEEDPDSDKSMEF
jgi:hypothetical protein